MSAGATPARPARPASTLEGETHSLALPDPVTAYVHLDQVRAA